jgi:hypothetical protein
MASIIGNREGNNFIKFGLWVNDNIVYNCFSFESTVGLEKTAASTFDGWLFARQNSILFGK